MRGITISVDYHGFNGIKKISGVGMSIYDAIDDFMLTLDDCLKEEGANKTGTGEYFSEDRIKLQGEIQSIISEFKEYKKELQGGTKI